MLYIYICKIQFYYFCFGNCGWSDCFQATFSGSEKVLLFRSSRLWLPTDPKALPRVAQQSEPRNPGSKYEDSRGLEGYGGYMLQKSRKLRCRHVGQLQFLTELCYPFCWMWPTLCLVVFLGHLILRDARRHLVPISFYLDGIIFQDLFHWMHFQLTVLGRYPQTRIPSKSGSLGTTLTTNWRFPRINQSWLTLDITTNNDTILEKKGRVKTTHWEILQLKHIFHKKSHKTIHNHSQSWIDNPMVADHPLPGFLNAGIDLRLPREADDLVTFDSQSGTPGMWFSEDGFGMINSIEPWWFLKPTFVGDSTPRLTHKS